MHNLSISFKAYYRCARLLLLLCGLAWVSALSAYEVSVQADTNAAGSADIISNVAYSIKDDDCLIRWNAIQYKTDNKRELKVTRQCDFCSELCSG